MTVLTLIRHAPTKWNEEGRLQGRTDVPLSVWGRTELADWRVPPDLAEASWVSSPLSRALETARALGAEPAVEKRLIEIDWGAWEGKTLAKIGRSLGRDLPEMEARGLDFQAPDGESPDAVRQRIQSWLSETATLGRAVVAVTHKGVIQAVMALAAGGNTTGEAPVKLARNTCHRLRLDNTGAPRVERANVAMLPERLERDRFKSNRFET